MHLPDAHRSEDAHVYTVARHFCSPVLNGPRAVGQGLGTSALGHRLAIPCHMKLTLVLEQIM